MKKITIIAEIGINHNGDFNIAKKLRQQLRLKDLLKNKNYY